MTYDLWFDTDENKVLLAICARRLIGNIGIGGIVWGLFNIVIGAFTVRLDAINAGILILGVIMLAAGIHARARPSLRVLLVETGVAVILFLWNLGMAVYNARTGAPFSVQIVIFPLAITTMFIQNYRRLQHVRERVESVSSETLRAAKQMCKAIVKKKLKRDPTVLQTSNGKCRGQLMAEKVLFIQRDLMRAFLVPKDELRKAIAKPDAKSLTLAFEHPLGRIKYRLDRKSSDKLKQWFAVTMPPPVPVPSPP